MEIIFATSNAHKASEVNQILGVDQCQLKTLKDINFTEDIAETGATLNENAWIKTCLLYTSPSPRDLSTSRMPSSA